MLDFYEFGQSIISGNLPNWVILIKTILIAFSLFLLGCIIYFLIFTDYMYLRFFENIEEYQNWRRRKKSKRGKFRRVVKTKAPAPVTSSALKKDEKLKPKGEGGAEDREWQRIFEKAKSKKDINCKLALVDADKLLNKRLEEIGIQGRNLSEKLEQASANLISNSTQLKQARKLVNQILLNGDKKVDRKTIEMAIKIYQKTYNSLRGG